MAEVAVGAMQAVMAGLVPAIHDGPAHERRQARKALRPSAILTVAPTLELVDAVARRGWPGQARP